MEQTVTARIYEKNLKTIRDFVVKHPIQPNGEKMLTRDVICIAIEYANAHGALS